MKVLFVTSGSIGDAIIASGILAYLTDSYPEARFTIAGGPGAVTLFTAFPKLDRLIPIRKQPWHRHWLAFWKQVWQERWDIIVDLRGGILGFLLRAGKRYIFHKPDKMKSKAAQLAALLKLDHVPATRLWSSEEARGNAARLLPHGEEIIVIAPRTNSTAKDWPVGRFAELAKRLQKEGRVFVVLAAKEQQASVQKLVQAVPKGHMVDLSGATDLLTAYAILERARLFIGNDSGLLHMAAAAGTDCVGIYGPSNDKKYAPCGKHVKIVKSYEFAMDEEEKRDNAYMQKISVEEVEAAARYFLKT